MAISGGGGAKISLPSSARVSGGSMRPPPARVPGGGGSLSWQQLQNAPAARAGGSTASSSSSSSSTSSQSNSGSNSTNSSAGSGGSGPAAPPFLTPAQQFAENNALSGDQNKIIALNEALGAATGKFDTAMANNQYAATVSTDKTNQAAGARGIFGSSINASDLADIQTALTVKDNALRAALNSTTLRTQQNITDVTGDINNRTNYYDQLAVANAQAIPPTVGVITPSSTGLPNTGTTSTGSTHNNQSATGGSIGGGGPRNSGGIESIGGGHPGSGPSSRPTRPKQPDGSTPWGRTGGGWGV